MTPPKVLSSGAAGAFDMEMLLLIRVLLLRCRARCLTIGWSRRKYATFSKTLTFLLWKPFMSFHLDSGAALCVLPRGLQEACCCLRVADGSDWKYRHHHDRLWPSFAWPIKCLLSFFSFFLLPCKQKQLDLYCSQLQPSALHVLNEGQQNIKRQTDTFKFPLRNKWMTRNLFDSPDKLSVCLLIRTLGWVKTGPFSPFTRTT